MKNLKTVIFGQAITRVLPFRQIFVNRQNRVVSMNLLRVLYWVFLLVAVWVGDMLLGFAFEKALLSSNFRFSTLYNGTGKSEIVILGNSRGHSYFQPEIQKLTGKTTLNLSYNAMPISVSEALMQDYLDLYGAPEKVLIEVTMLNKTEEEVISAFKVYGSQSKRISSLIEEKLPSVYKGGKVSSLYNFNSEVFHRSLYYLKGSDVSWVVDRNMTGKLVANASALHPMKYSLTQDRLTDLNEMIAACKKAGVTPVLVFAPLYPAYRSTIQNLDSFVKNIESSTGLIVHDYSNIFSKPEFFSDYLHLNKKGSIAFMQQLHRDKIF